MTKKRIIAVVCLVALLFCAAPMFFPQYWPPFFQIINGIAKLTGLNGIIEGAVNALAYGLVLDVRSDSTCNLNNNGGSPGTITGCSTINFTQKDVGKLLRTAYNFGSPFEGCIASVQSSSAATIGTITRWAPSTSYTAGQAVEDWNGNTQTAQGNGTSNTTNPVWANTFNATTADNTVTWKLTAFGTSGLCTAASYTLTSSLTANNVFVEVGTDALSALSRTINFSKTPTTTAPIYTGVQLPLPNALMMVSDTINIFVKTGHIWGHGAFAQTDGTAALTSSGTGIIWVGPRGHPVFKLAGTQGMRLTDFEIQGNSNQSNKPSACVDLVQEIPQFNGVNQVNELDNIGCNYASRVGQDPDAGQVLGTVGSGGPNWNLSTYGVLWDPLVNAQNERMRLSHVLVDAADTCYALNEQQTGFNDLMDLTCAGSSSAVFVNGSNVIIRNFEALNTGTKFILALSHLETDNFGDETDSCFTCNIPFSNRLGIFQAGGHLFMQGGGADLDNNVPASGVAFDGNGTGIYPVGVWNGSSGVTVQNNQIVQPPAYYPDWSPSQYYQIPSPVPWYANSPFAPEYVIQPVNNNAGNYYFEVKQTANASGPGFTGATEPTWTQTVGATTDDGSPTGCGNDVACGIRWTNIGNVLPVIVIVPRLGNPGGYAFKPTVGGQAGATEPQWCQSAGCTVADNGVTWKNLGVYQPNYNNWVFKNTTGSSCTSGNSMPKLNQTLSGTTTDNGCTWTTTLAGQNTQVADVALTNFAIALGANATNFTTAPPIFEFNQAAPSNSAPSINFNCLNCQGLSTTPAPFVLSSNTYNSAAQVVSNDGGISTSPWIRYITFNGRILTLGNGSIQPQTDLLRLPVHVIPENHRYDLNGKVNVFGQVNVTPVVAPVGTGGFCNAPDWTANTQFGAKWVLEPETNNAGSYFFQTTPACTGGGTYPASWNQTPAGTTTDGGCTWTNVGNGSGSPSAGAAGTYYIRWSYRVGSINTKQQETTAAPEQSIACGPTDSQTGVTVSVPVAENVGGDSVGYYASTSSTTETLVAIVPFGTDAFGTTVRIPLSQIPAPDWAANTAYLIYKVLAPQTNNAGSFCFAATKSGFSGGTVPGAWNQTIGGTTSDGSTNWINVGNCALPTVNTTGGFDPQGPFVSYPFASLGTPVNGTVHYCPDCTIANPCAGSGTGAIAKRLNGAWVCN